MRHLQARRHGSGCAGQRRVRPRCSGLQTTPSVLQTASASPEAVCLELRHFWWRESLKTDAKAMWLVSPDVRSTYSEDGAVLLDIRKGLCYSLNAVGARMWLTMEASQTGMTLEGIVGALETDLNVPRQELETDMAEYLDKLLA